MNFRIRRHDGETCNHRHHSRGSALRCLEVLGWDPAACTVEEFDHTEGMVKRSLHHGGRARGKREAEW